MSSSTLLEKVLSGELTAEATEAATAELRQRNIDVEEHRNSPALPATVPASPLQVFLWRWFVPTEKPADVWWIYFGIAIAMILLWIIRSVTSIGHSSPLIQTLATVTVVVDTFACIGLWGYLRSVRLGTRTLWKACFWIKLAQFLAAPTILRWAAGEFSALQLLGMVVELPLLVALGRYAYQSLGFWRRKVRAAAPLDGQWISYGFNAPSGIRPQRSRRPS